MDRKDYIKAYLKDYRSRTKCVNLAIPMADYRRLERAARGEGKKPTQFLVEIGIAQIDKAIYVPEAISRELQSLRFLIRNVANNLNQIAHHTNTVKRAADERSVLKELKALEQLVQDYTLGKLRNARDHKEHEP